MISQKMRAGRTVVTNNINAVDDWAFVVTKGVQTE